MYGENRTYKRFSDPRTICLTHPENLASVHVAKNSGSREISRRSL